MTQSRTARGATASKTSSTTLVLADVPMDAGSELIVAVAWEDGGQNDKPTVQWGSRDMRYIAGSEQTRADTVLRFYRKRNKKGKTRDITITWANAKAAKAMFATQITEASQVDVQQGNSQGGGNVNKNTGPTGLNTTDPNTVHIAAFACLGPNTETPTGAGAGHTLGQSAGTSGGGAASNIHLHETYELLTSINNCRATLTQSVGRACASRVIAFAPVQTYTISRAYYVANDGHPDMEAVVFVLEDETNTEVFEVRIPRREFQELTNDEVNAYIQARVQWYADKVYDNAPSPDWTPTTGFNNRVAGFVNDTFPV